MTSAPHRDRWRRALAGLATLGALATAGTSGRAQDPQIDKVVIAGNARVDEEAIRVHLRSAPGTPFDRETVSRDVRAIYGMGFFEQVEVDWAEPGGEGILTFRVVERPFIRALRIEGAREVKREDIEAALKVRPHTILDPEKVRQGLGAAKKLYEEKGYLDAVIEERTVDVGENEVELVYDVDEKDLIRIRRIEFEGNSAFTDRRLRKVLTTKEKWLLSRFTGAGVLNRDVLKTDMERLAAHYYDNGYITVKVDEPIVERREGGLFVTLKIEEGEQYRVGAVSIEGEGVGDVSSIVADLATKPAEVFRASDLRRDVQRVSDVFSDEGYAFANVEPVTDIRPEERLVDIAFAVDKGRQVYIDRIDIAGNVKTRDKVVRRELKLQEQELFSATKLRTSREALQRLGFFQEVNITTRRSAADDRVNVVVDVKEGQTGAFSAGAGYSSADRILFNARVSENNLFGRGQRIVLNGDLGSIRRNIILSFTEPYLFDTPLTLGLDAFSWRLLFDEFTRDGTGFSTRTLYPLTALGFREVWGLPLTEVRAGFDYRLERAKIQDLGFGATRSIRLEEGSSVISSVAPRLLRNTLNHAFDPTAGSFQDLSLEFAGLGGDTSFLKAEARSRWYYSFWRSPRFGTFTYALGGTVGYGLGDEGIGGNELPLFERYFPGGLSSIRGFKARTLGPREIRKNVLGQEIADTPIGGSRELVVNNEVIFPIAQALGLKGVMFFDAGNAFTADAGYDIGDLRYAVGGGVRWLSPLGPLRVELGLPLNREPREDKSVVLFSFGGPLQ